MARVLLIAAVVSGAVLAVSASARVERRAAEPWTGTVTVVEDLDVTYAANNVPVTWHVTYHDQATYTLTGMTTADGLSVATMAGSGVGRATGTSSSPNVCPVPADPLEQWSFTGAANVSIAYANGVFVVQPQPTDTTYTTVNRFTACPFAGRGDETGTRTGPAPWLLDQIHPKGQAAAETTTSLTGSEDIPLSFAGVANAGKATVTWNLTRPGAPGGGGGGTLPPGSPPTGTATGNVLVDGKPYTGGPIPYGSTVDVTKGRLTLETEVGTLTVSGGGVSAVFKLLRSKEKGKVVVELRLVKGDFSLCKKAFRLTQAKKPPKKTVRRLFTQGKGRFRTRGRYSAAAVRGTNWLTADRCDGTLTSVKQGKVEVRDFVKNKRVLVKAGKSYLAQPRR